MLKPANRICLVLFGAFLLNLNTPEAVTAQGKSAAAQYPYRDSERGLKSLFGDLMAARREGDEAGFQRLVDSLVLTDPKGWFAATFGPEIGADYAAAYIVDKGAFRIAFGRVLDEMARLKLTNVLATRFDEACDSKADPDQYPVLVTRINQAPIYQVLFRDQSESLSRRLWAFAYVEGAFRYLQPLQVKEPHWRIGGQFISLNSEILESKLVHMEKPIYPAEAVRNYIQGSVKLWVIVSKDGMVKDVWILEGNCVLSRAAVQAVKKWRYTPTLVAGIAVDVVAPVEVKFQLGSR